MTITIIKPVNWKGVVIFKVKSKKTLRELAKKFRNYTKRQNIRVSFERKKKVEQVV